MSSRSLSRTSPRVSPRVSPSPQSRSSRKLYQNTLTAGLNVDCLERFLCRDMAAHCTDHRLCTRTKLLFTGLANRIRRNGLEKSQEDLCNAGTVLRAFLSNSQDLPAPIVFETHSLLGLVNAGLRDHNAARQHFLKALWVASCSAKQQNGEIPQEQLAITMHRLAKIYAACRAYGGAKSLLVNALDYYTCAGLAKDHCCVVDAGRLLDDIEAASAAENAPTLEKETSFH